MLYDSEHQDNTNLFEHGFDRFLEILGTAQEMAANGTPGVGASG